MRVLPGDTEEKRFMITSHSAVTSDLGIPGPCLLPDFSRLNIFA